VVEWCGFFLFSLFFFFFQAEDGIRDLYVTGVQTCALPIYHNYPHLVAGARGSALRDRSCSGAATPDLTAPQPVFGGTNPAQLDRSEERRVGKECRARWWRYH